MRALYDQVGWEISELLTKRYSTSFSLGIRLLSKELRPHVYAIYGFSRLADEIVDTFLEHDRETLLNEYKLEVYSAIDNKVSTNPVVNAFQITVNEFGIERALIDTFLHSMEMDLNPEMEYTQELFDEYVLGSAEVIGLMCLKVFCKGDHKMYEDLKPSAMSLGAAFQKVNFLRDAHFDYNTLNRVYFPNVDFDRISKEELQLIFQDIEKDFEHALSGIKRMPNSSRFGVFLAYRYYLKLFLKIKRSTKKKFLNSRIRISNHQKANILLRSLVRYRLNLY